MKRTHIVLLAALLIAAALLSACGAGSTAEAEPEATPEPTAAPDPVELVIDKEAGHCYAELHGAEARFDGFTQLVERVDTENKTLTYLGTMNLDPAEDGRIYLDAPTTWPGVDGQAYSVVACVDENGVSGDIAFTVLYQDKAYPLSFDFSTWRHAYEQYELWDDESESCFSPRTNENVQLNLPVCHYDEFPADYSPEYEDSFSESMRYKDVKIEDCPLPDGLYRLGLISILDWDWTFPEEFVYYTIKNGKAFFVEADENGAGAELCPCAAYYPGGLNAGEYYRTLNQDRDEEEYFRGIHRLAAHGYFAAEWFYHENELFSVDCRFNLQDYVDHANGQILCLGHVPGIEKNPEDDSIIYQFMPGWPRLDGHLLHMELCSPTANGEKEFWYRVPVNMDGVEGPRWLLLRQNEKGEYKLMGLWDGESDFSEAVPLKKGDSFTLIDYVYPSPTEEAVPREGARIEYTDGLQPVKTRFDPPVVVGHALAFYDENGILRHAARQWFDLFGYNLFHGLDQNAGYELSDRYGDAYALSKLTLERGPDGTPALRIDGPLADLLDTYELEARVYYDKNKSPDCGYDTVCRRSEEDPNLFLTELRGTHLAVNGTPLVGTDFIVPQEDGRKYYRVFVSNDWTDQEEIRRGYDPTDPYNSLAWYIVIREDVETGEITTRWLDGIDTPTAQSYHRGVIPEEEDYSPFPENMVFRALTYNGNFGSSFPIRLTSDTVAEYVTLDGSYAVEFYLLEWDGESRKTVSLHTGYYPFRVENGEYIFEEGEAPIHLMLKTSIS